MEDDEAHLSHRHHQLMEEDRYSTSSLSVKYAGVQPPAPISGKPIKSRLLKKHKGPEVPMEIDQPVPLATKPCNETLVIHNEKSNGFPATYGRENSTLSLPETKNDALQGLHFGRKLPG